MPLDPTTFAHWLSASGITHSEELDTDRALAQQLARQQLGRDADALTANGVVAALQGGMQVSELQVALLGSYERLVSDNYIAEDNSAAFRRLSSVAIIEGLAASSTDVAECIAVYRVLLGREPESVGFSTFLSNRQSQSLALAVVPILRSSETADHYAPDQPPSLTLVLQMVHILAGQVLHAAASDTTLGIVRQVRSSVESLEDRLEALEKNLLRYMSAVLLRLDSEALQE